MSGGKGGYFDTVRSMTADPELLAAVDKAEAATKSFASKAPERNPAPCACGHSHGKHLCGGKPIACKRSGCRCRRFAPVEERQPRWRERLNRWVRFLSTAGLSKVTELREEDR